MSLRMPMLSTVSVRAGLHNYLVYKLGGYMCICLHASTCAKHIWDTGRWDVGAGVWDTWGPASQWVCYGEVRCEVAGRGS